MRGLVLTGFLGSGKTTLVLALAEQLLADGNRVAIIENERGGIGIDGPFLEAQGLTVREIRAGCVCCELVLPLRRTVELLRDTIQPDWILLEASGVANADSLRESLEHPPIDTALWQFLAVLDTARFDRLWSEHHGIGTLVRPQVAQADVLVLTKIDRVSEEALLSAAEAVQRQRPDAPVLPFLADDQTCVELILEALGLPTDQEQASDG